MRLYYTKLYDSVYDYVFSPQCSEVPWGFLWPYFRGWLSVCRAKNSASVCQTRAAIVAALSLHGQNQPDGQIDDLAASQLLHAIIAGNDSKEVFRVCYGRKFEDGVLAQTTAYWQLLLNCYIGATQAAREALKDVYKVAHDHWSLDKCSAQPTQYYPGRNDSPLEITATCLSIAVRAGHFDTVQMLLGENELDLWPHDFSFPAPLLYVRTLQVALKNGQSELAQKLLSLPGMQPMNLTARINAVWTNAKDDMVRKEMLRYLVGDAIADTHQLSTLQTWTSFATRKVELSAEPAKG